MLINRFLRSSIPLFVLFFFLGCEKKENTPAKVIPPAITNDPIAGSKIINSTFVSKNVTDFVFNIDIYLPPSYDSNKNLPVLYVIDGQSHFELMTTEWIDKDFEAIIVGIGADKNNASRFKYLIPTDFDCTDCGFLQYYKFLTEELIPFVDENYENNQGERILYGHSYGAVFALSSLFIEDQKKILFHNYLVIDPNDGFDIVEKFMLNQKLENNLDKLKMYMSVSGGNSETKMERFLIQLNDGNFSWLDYKFERFLEETHISLVPLSLDAGMKYILNTE